MDVGEKKKPSIQLSQPPLAFLWGFSLYVFRASKTEKPNSQRKHLLRRLAHSDLLFSAAIVVSGFHQVIGLFAISMIFWFCVAYMFIRDFCGEAIYSLCCVPVISLLRRKWRYLRW